MQPVSTLAERARHMTYAAFRAEVPSPALVAQQIIGGRLGRHNAHYARATSGAGRIARIKPSTLLHIEPHDIDDPRADDIMITRPLSREMWVPLAKGAATPGHAPITIGRAASCDVVINDYTVSKRHAYFVIDPLVDCFRLVDAGSTNGTRIDERWLEPGERATVRSGQVVTLGRLICVFMGQDAFYRYLTEGTEDVPSVDLVIGT